MDSIHGRFLLGILVELKGVHPKSCIPRRKKVVGAIGVADCILRNAD